MINFFKEHKVVFLESLILFGIFALSVAMRYPILNRPLSDGDENMTAHVLLVMRSWSQNGIFNQRLSPSENFGNPADKYVSGNVNNGRMLLDKSGNYFYVSFPPLAFILPYFVSKTLPIPDVLAVQGVNIFLGFLTALLIYWIVKIIHPTVKSNIVALLATGVYALVPGNLWYNSNAYFADMPVQPFWAAGILLILVLTKRDVVLSRYKAFWLQLALAVALFFTIYSEWLGIFFAASIFLYGIAFWKRGPIFKALVFISAISTLVALALTIWQYGSIAGLKSFWDVSLQNYIFRSVAAGGLFRFATVINITVNFLNYYLPALLLLLYLFAGAVTVFRGRIAEFFSADERRVLYFAFLPPILHYAVLLQSASVHGFAPMKFSIAVSLLVGFLYLRLQENLKSLESQPKKLQKFIIWGAVAALVLFTDSQYVRKFTGYSDGDRYVIAGNAVREYAPADSTVFTIFPNNLDYIPEPQFTYYAGRNMEPAKDLDGIIKWMKDHSRSKGIIFYLDGYANRIRVASAKAIEILNKK